MNSLATQPQFDLRIPTRRPLWPMKAAMVFLDRNEDDVLALIQVVDRRAGGCAKLGLEFAFNVARPGRKQYALVWRGSAIEYKSQFEDPENRSPSPRREWNLQGVINDILPARDSLRAVEIKNLFSVNQGHVAHLIADGLLTVDKTRPVAVGRAQSPWITRASVAEFLRARRML